MGRAAAAWVVGTSMPGRPAAGPEPLVEGTETHVQSLSADVLQRGRNVIRSAKEGSRSSGKTQQDDVGGNGGSHLTGDPGGVDGIGA